MSTINAQTIIDALRQAHAIAPDEGTEYITFRTSARGTHRIVNDKAHILRFADLVRKHAAAFGGGLIRESKTRPAVSYQSKTISLYKQLIEDKDWYAALQLAEGKLSPLFFFGNDGKSHMQVAPIPLDSEPRLVSLLGEDGKWSVCCPVSMLGLDSLTGNKRSRQAQIDAADQHLRVMKPEKKEAMMANAHARPVDQSAARAQWMADHGIVDDAAIEARIEAQATQDVDEVVAQAVAVSAIAEAMAPAAETESTPELVTCEAGESESNCASIAQFINVAADSVGTLRKIDVSRVMDEAPTQYRQELAAYIQYNRPDLAQEVSDVLEESTHTTTPAVISGTVTSPVVESAEITAPAPEPVPVVEIEATTPAAEIQIEPVAHVVGTESPQAAKEPTPTPDDTQKFRVRAKSGEWRASFMMIGTMYALLFNGDGSKVTTTTYATHQERMQALETMARATTTPDSPPDGGLPIAPADAPTEAPAPSVAECTPDTPSAVSRAKPEHDLKVGDVVRSSWGYDQTNVNHYQITKLIGKRTVEVRELVEHKESTGDMTGHVAPVWGEFIGEPMRRTVDRHGHVNILREKFGRASKIEPVAVVHGVRCYASTGYSSYA